MLLSAVSWHAAECGLWHAAECGFMVAVLSGVLYLPIQQHIITLEIPAAAELHAKQLPECSTSIYWDLNVDI